MPEFLNPPSFFARHEDLPAMSRLNNYFQTELPPAAFRNLGAMALELQPENYSMGARYLIEAGVNESNPELSINDFSDAKTLLRTFINDTRFTQISASEKLQAELLLASLPSYQAISVNCSIPSPEAQEQLYSVGRQLCAEISTYISRNNLEDFHPEFIAEMHGLGAETIALMLQQRLIHHGWLGENTVVVPSTISQDNSRVLRDERTSWDLSIFQCADQQVEVKYKSQVKSSRRPYLQSINDKTNIPYASDIMMIFMSGEILKYADGAQIHRSTALRTLANSNLDSSGNNALQSMESRMLLTMMKHDQKLRGGRGET
jgi:hypothetical protein